jgi:hypothetical protein
MTTTAWIVSYALSTLFWLWIACWGGADRLETTFASGCLVSLFAPDWSAEGLRLFAYVMLVLDSVIFLVGLFMPELRSLWS